MIGDLLWRIEHFGEGPVGAIVRAPTSEAALTIFRNHLEGYEGCYRSTGSQRITVLPDEQDIIHVELRQIGGDWDA